MSDLLFVNVYYDILPVVPDMALPYLFAVPKPEHVTFIWHLYQCDDDGGSSDVTCVKQNIPIDDDRKILFHIGIRTGSPWIKNNGLCSIM